MRRVRSSTARCVGLPDMTHERVFDESKALLVEPVLLDGIIDEIE
jgi:hypothetical protein